MARNDNARRHGSLPYDGLFGDSNIVSVIEQIIADPYTVYHPIDLARFTKETPPTVRKSLKTLTSLGLLIKDRTDLRHPIYRVNTESKRFLALNLLAYAILDDKLGTDTMDKIIADYCDSVLREKYSTGFAFEYLSAHLPAEQSVMGVEYIKSEPMIEIRGESSPGIERYELEQDAEINLPEPHVAAA